MKEPVRVGRAELLELRRANPRVDPVLCLAGHGRHRVLVPLDRVEPVLDALLDRVSGRGVNTGLDLIVEFVEPVPDDGLGPTAYRAPVARAVGVVAERDG